MNFVKYWIAPIGLPPERILMSWYLLGSLVYFDFSRSDAVLWDRMAQPNHLFYLKFRFFVAGFILCFSQFCEYWFQFAGLFLIRAACNDIYVA